MNEENTDSLSGLISSAKQHCFLGDSNKALDNLEKAVNAGIPGVAYINNDIDFNILRNEPRFQALIDKMGLIRYQDK